MAYSVFLLLSFIFRFHLMYLSFFHIRRCKHFEKKEKKYSSYVNSVNFVILNKDLVYFVPQNFSLNHRNLSDISVRIFDFILIERKHFKVSKVISLKCDGRRVDGVTKLCIDKLN